MYVIKWQLLKKNVWLLRGLHPDILFLVICLYVTLIPLFTALEQLLTAYFSDSLGHQTHRAIVERNYQRYDSSESCIRLDRLRSSGKVVRRDLRQGSGHVFRPCPLVGWFLGMIFPQNLGGGWAPLALSVDPDRATDLGVFSLYSTFWDMLYLHLRYLCFFFSSFLR